MSKRPRDPAARRVLRLAKKLALTTVERIPLGEPEEPASSDREKWDRLGRLVEAKSVSDRLWAFQQHRRVRYNERTTTQG